MSLSVGVSLCKLSKASGMSSHYKYVCGCEAVGCFSIWYCLLLCVMPAVGALRVLMWHLCSRCLCLSAVVRVFSVPH